MALFRKPSWLKPEVNEVKYWLHALIVSFLILFVLQLFKTMVITAALGNMLSIKNVILLTVLFVLSDVIAHTVLKLD
jgi:hypothetical protein